MDNLVIVRNEVYNINISNNVHTKKLKPVIVVSSFILNDAEEFLIVVPIEEKETKMLPTHLVVNESTYKGIVHCESLMQIKKNQIEGDVLGTISSEVENEMNLKICIALEMGIDKSNIDNLLNIFKKEYEKQSKKEEKLIENKVKEKTKEIKDECDKKVKENTVKLKKELSDYKEIAKKEIESLKKSIEDEITEKEDELKVKNALIEELENKVANRSYETIINKLDNEKNMLKEELEKLKEELNSINNKKNINVSVDKETQFKIWGLEIEKEMYMKNYFDIKKKYEELLRR